MHDAVARAADAARSVMSSVLGEVRRKDAHAGKGQTSPRTVRGVHEAGMDTAAPLCSGSTVTLDDNLRDLHARSNRWCQTERARPRSEPPREL